jgi:hypothetical protein
MDGKKKSLWEQTGRKTHDWSGLKKKLYSNADEEKKKKKLMKPSIWEQAGRKV